MYLRLPPRDRINWGEAALAAARRIKDPYAAAAHLHKLALAYIDMGKTDRPIECLKEAVAINRQIKRPEYEAADLGALVWLMRPWESIAKRLNSTGRRLLFTGRLMRSGMKVYI